MRLRFVDADNNDINMFQSLENPCTFLFTKEKTWKRIFNSELPQNRTEKQIMPFKTTMNWLVNDIWCYLLIACFDWEVGVFQQAFVRFYYINTYWALPDEPQKKKFFRSPTGYLFPKWAGWYCDNSSCYLRSCMLMLDMILTPFVFWFYCFLTFIGIRLFELTFTPCYKYATLIMHI